MMPQSGRRSPLPRSSSWSDRMLNAKATRRKPSSAHTGDVNDGRGNHPLLRSARLVPCASWGGRWGVDLATTAFRTLHRPKRTNVLTSTYRQISRWRAAPFLLLEEEI